MTLSLLRWVIATGLAAHGIAHLVGAAVSWRLVASPDVPHHTSVLNGRLNVGDAGIRLDDSSGWARRLRSLAAQCCCCGAHRPP